MFTVEGIVVLGIPLGTEGYIKNFVAQNCLKIIRDVEKLEPLTDGFTHFQLIQKTMNTRTQFMSVNITLPPQGQFLSAEDRHVDTVIANSILKKGTRNSFHLWPKNDYDLGVTMLQMPHTLSRRIWFDTECHCTNFSQGCYGSSFPGIGRIFTNR